VLASAGEATDPARLAGLLERSQATVAQGTPSAWQALRAADWAGSPGLRAWSGGEPLSRDLADWLTGHCAEAWNLYGPTETTIWSARWKVAAGEPVAIGKPIENTRFYVLDEAGRLVPPGIPGELFIAGDGVALGYAARPEETRLRFRTIEPASGTASPGTAERAYRTGDLVRQLPDGNFLCLGRTDLQVKVRGHRIEPEEIEHALRGCPHVADAAVTVGATGALVAHVIASGPVSEAKLAAEAGRRLPGYMVPRAYAFHDAFPQTANRKVDRKALAAEAPGPGPATPQAPYAEPEGEIETAVADAFREALRAGRIGRHDDFFRLGGHSLLTVGVQHRLAERLGVRIDAHEMFRCPTVAGLAAAVRAARDRARAGEAEETAISDALARLESMSDAEAAELLRDSGNGAGDHAGGHAGNHAENHP
jgi:hypothetical protein